MPSHRKRTKPVTDTIHGERIVNAKTARTTIRRFHVLLKKKAQLEKIPASARVDPGELIEEVEQEINELGGLHNYQTMSRNGQSSQRGGGSHLLLIEWLHELEYHTKSETDDKFRLLEVGALYPDNYKTCRKWMTVLPIDLNDSVPGVIKQDMLLLDRTENRSRWNCISLSLVLNFAPDNKDRGRMLLLSYEFLVNGGLLFIVLPAPCVRNSRYLDQDVLLTLMMSIGFKLIRERSKSDGRLVYYLFKKDRQGDGQGLDKWKRKRVVLEGSHRNNFSILLPEPSSSVHTRVT